MSTHDQRAHGRCLCGAVAYGVRGELRPVVNCHCARCRRACGSSLFWRSEDAPEQWSICAGTLEPPTRLSTVEAWWVSQASDYASRPDLPERATE